MNEFLLWVIITIPVVFIVLLLMGFGPLLHYIFFNDK
jgi:hypothetical protein